MGDLRQFARTLPGGKTISALGFGCSSMWSRAAFPLDEALAILEAAASHGINHFDTAPSYADGEVRLGRFLAGRDPADFVISTKVGTEAADKARSFAPDRMRRSLEDSLGKLGLGSVDILYLHGPALTDLNDETFRFFEEVKREGLIRLAGVNSFEPAVVDACQTAPIDAVMLQYNLADLRFAEPIRRLHDAGKVVMAGTILAQSIFNPRTFVPTSRESLWYALRALSKDPLFLWRGRQLAARIAPTGMDPHTAAIRFCLSNPGLTSNLFSTRSDKHLIANIAAASELLSPETIALLAGRAG